MDHSGHWVQNLAGMANQLNHMEELPNQTSYPSAGASLVKQLKPQKPFPKTNANKHVKQTRNSQVAYIKSLRPAFPFPLVLGKSRVPLEVAKRIMTFLICPYEPNALRNCPVIVRDLLNAGRTCKTFYLAYRYALEFFAETFIEKMPQGANWNLILSDPLATSRTQIGKALKLLKFDPRLDRVGTFISSHF